VIERFWWAPGIDPGQTKTTRKVAEILKEKIWNLWHKCHWCI